MQMPGTSFNVTAKNWLRAALLGACTLALLPHGTAAQGLFSSAVTVNDRAITQYEVNQRALLLQFFNTPGDAQQNARESLIDDALRQEELARYTIALTDEQYDMALAEFAGRANLTPAQLLANMGQLGIDGAALRDYLRVSVLWRDYVRARFNSTITVTEADIDAYIARAATASQGMEILLSELIMPLVPGQEQQIQQLAQQFSQLTSTAAFSDAAREYSVTNSRANGGQMDWVPLANFPPGLQNVLSAMSPGQVTAPLGIEGGVALLQVRGLREGRIANASVASVEYAVMQVPSVAAAERILPTVATCDDLYTHNLQNADVTLTRQSVAPAQVPAEVAPVISTMNPGNIIATPTANGATITMLCARNITPPQGLTRELASNLVRGERLESRGDRIIAELRANAVIR
ncbi:Peptidyl-prolyl cis-trans isomerase SurA, putative [Ketogulonicigenium vulgare WSH-001]|uniref:Parvulin-like PPIase n=2 Tax=Ketogulonicigenium vulgare TaxID=92945 RepID=F9Y6X2_KETVW|nr:Peptidyl-prolyl cis-trans isomerase SurA, putative [Ketogulonicigenium vulgare WSH-001]